MSYRPFGDQANEPDSQQDDHDAMDDEATAAPLAGRTIGEQIGAAIRHVQSSMRATFPLLPEDAEKFDWYLWLVADASSMSEQPISERGRTYARRYGIHGENARTEDEIAAGQFRHSFGLFQFTKTPPLSSLPPRTPEETAEAVSAYLSRRYSGGAVEWTSGVPMLRPAPADETEPITTAEAPAEPVQTEGCRAYIRRMFGC